MAIDQVDRTVVTQEPTVAGQETVQTDSRRTTFVGWTILELIVLWVIGIFARRSAAATV